MKEILIFFLVLKGLRPFRAPQRKAEHPPVPRLPELLRSALRASAQPHAPAAERAGCGSQTPLCSTVLAPRTHKLRRRYTAFVVYLCVRRG